MSLGVTAVSGAVPATPGSCSPLKNVSVYILWPEELSADRLYDAGVEVLARKYIQIRVTRLVAKMSRDITRLNQLDESISGFVALSEVLHHRTTVRIHIDSPHHRVTECNDVVRAPDERHRAPVEI
jgi:hypothetical protein